MKNYFIQITLEIEVQGKGQEPTLAELNQWGDLGRDLAIAGNANIVQSLLHDADGNMIEELG